MDIRIYNLEIHIHLMKDIKRIIFLIFFLKKKLISYKSIAQVWRAKIQLYMIKSSVTKLNNFILLYPHSYNIE